MEYLILIICCLGFRSGYKYNRESVYKYQTDMREMDQLKARIDLRLKNAADYLNEAEVTGNEEYLRFAIEEREKAEQLIRQFKKRYKV